MKIEFSRFNGVQALIEPTAMSADYGQAADNVWLERGDLRALERPRQVYTLTKPGTQAIYRFGQATASETEFWFHWAAPVSVAKAQVAADTTERTIIMGDGAPRFATSATSTAGANLPSAAQLLALPAPAGSPTLALVPGTGVTGTVRRDYVYTITNEQGDESAPSPIATIDCATDQHVTVGALDSTASNGVPVATRRVYRSEAGVYLYVGETGAAGATFVDNVATDSLGGELLSTEWDAPLDSFRGVVNLPNGLMAAFSGRDVYFCVPYSPYAWPEKYRLAMPYPVVGMGVIDQSLVVVTTGDAQIITGVDPGGMDQRPAKLYQPGSSLQSVVSSGADVYYASEAGICRVGAGRAEVATRGLFTTAQWSARYNPPTIRAAWHDGAYIGSYEQGLTRRGFAFWPDTNRFVDLPDFGADAFYRDTVTSKLYCALAGQVWVFRGGSTAYDLRWVSARVVTPMTQLTWVRVRAAQYPVAVEVWNDGQLRDAVEVQGLSPQRIGDPTEIGYADNWEVVVRSGPVQSVVLAQSPTEAVNG